MISDSGTERLYGQTLPISFSEAAFARYQPSRVDYIQEFYRLLKRWRYETLTRSSTDEIIAHPAFQDIVALGEPVVPFIVDEIRVRPDHLIAALILITGADPVPDHARGDFQEMANSWIAWYERRQ